MKRLWPVEVVSGGVRLKPPGAEHSLVVQIIASGSTVYDIPWPPEFMSLISTLRVFLVDVISITKANCARPMNYYDSMLVVLIGTKLVLALLLLGPWAWQRLKRSPLNVVVRANERSVRKRVSVLEDGMAGRRRASIAREIQQSLAQTQRDVAAVDWMKVFRTSFMVLFVAYPGASLLLLWASGWNDVPSMCG